MTHSRSNPVQPGCDSIKATHFRSLEYYVESVYPGNKYGFMGTICTSLTSLIDGSCSDAQYPMGIACPSSLRGELFLRTNSKPPFGLNSLRDSQIVCSSLNSNKTDVVY